MSVESSSQPKATNLKKKSPRRKTPPKLSIKQDLLLDKLKIFYNKKEHIDSFLEIINSSSKISLRIIDWFVTNYSKKNFVVIPVKKVISLNEKVTASKTKKKDSKPSHTSIDVNVFLNYKAQLKAYSKKHFDPFCRRERVSFNYNETESVVTTVGQLNFFKWAIDNGIIKYIQEHIDIIEEDMNNNIKKPKSKSKKKKMGELESVAGCGKVVNPILRKKRRELSTSAVKALNKHSGKHVLSFD